MLSFLNLSYLAWAAAAVVPLILHLMHRSRMVRVPFSTIRFLKLAQKRSSHRVRMENFVLWLLRTLLVILLAAAFAMPVLRTRAFGRFLSRSSRDVAVILDGSYSMRYLTGSGTAWDRALETALAVVEGLSPGDRVCVFAARAEVEPVIEQLSADLDQAAARIRALREGTTSCQLAPALVAALESLNRETRRREREIHIVTDGQALPWQSFRAAVRGAEPDAADEGDVPEGGGWNPALLDKRTALFVTFTGVPSPQNTAPLDAAPSPQTVMAGSPYQVRVRLGRTGTAPRTTVTISVDGERAAERSVEFQAGAAEVTAVLPGLDEGVHEGQIDLPLDNLAADNRFHFLVRARNRLPVLCVGEEEDVFYLVKALEAGEGGRAVIGVETADEAELGSRDLSGYVCVFLCNALPVSGQALVQLEDYVRSGGALAVFPGGRAGPDAYRPWESLPARPAAVADVPLRERKRTLRWETPQHPLLRGLPLAPGTAPVLNIRRALTLGDPAPSSEVLVRAGADQPFLATRPFGSGRVVLFSVAADRSWSNFPLSPFYLPIVHQVVRYAAGEGGEPAYLWTQRSLSLSDHVPACGDDSRLLGPDGKAVSVRRTMADGKARREAEDLTTPGIYFCEPAQGSDAVPVLAINLDRRESDLAALDRETVGDRVGGGTVVVADGKAGLLRAVGEYRVGRTLAELVLWMCLILAAVEVFLANRLARTPSALSDRLRVAASGKVARDGPATEGGS